MRPENSHHFISRKTKTHVPISSHHSAGRKQRIVHGFLSSFGCRSEEGGHLLRVVPEEYTGAKSGAAVSNAVFCGETDDEIPASVGEC